MKCFITIADLSLFEYFNRQLLEKQLKRKLEGNSVEEAHDTVDNSAVFSEKSVKVFSEESLSSYKSDSQVFFGIKIPENVDICSDPGKCGLHQMYCVVCLAIFLMNEW